MSSRLIEILSPLTNIKLNPVPDATDAMTLPELQNNVAKITERINYLLDQLQNGSIKNIPFVGELLDIHNAKLAQYEGKILQKEAAGNVTIDPVTGQPVKQDPELPPATQKPNWLLYGGIAAAIILIIRK